VASFLEFNLSKFRQIGTSYLVGILQLTIGD